LRWRPFSRSYGAILPSSLTKVLPLALVFSTHLPVSVCGTGSALQYTSTFSRLLVPVTSVSCETGIMVINHLPPQSTQGLTFPRVCECAPCTGTGILTSCPSTTPLGLALGPTNPTRTDLPSETLDFRRTWFSHVSRYSCRHSHSRTLQSTFRLAFAAYGTLPYQYTPKRIIPSFGAVLEPRYIIRATAFD
jgi:hypothetical protein